MLTFPKSFHAYSISTIILRDKHAKNVLYSVNRVFSIKFNTQKLEVF